MHGIDISKWQPTINLAKVPCDFVIVKATQGKSSVSNTFKNQIETSLKLQKLAGAYHYVDGSGVDAEAANFIKAVTPYLGKIILAIDWEAGGNAKFSDPSYCVKLLNKVKELTGVTPFVYMSKSVTRAHDWSAIKDFPLWCAQYSKENASKATSYQSKPWTDSKGFGAWKSPAIYQYSDHGRLSGFSGNLDLDLAYIGASAWKQYASINGANASVAAPVQTSKKSASEVAAEVVAGKWGSGNARKTALERAGYNYAEIQKAVNALLTGNKTATQTSKPSSAKKSIDEIAREVIAGKWGSGTERKKKLEAAGYNYTTIQKKVNQLTKKK